MMCAMLTMFRDWAIPEKLQTGGLMTYLPPPNSPTPIHGIFGFVTLPLEIPMKIYLNPMKIPRSKTKAR